MWWNQHCYERMVHWDRGTNTAIIRTTPGTKAYRAMMAMHEQLHPTSNQEEMVAYATIMSINDEKHTLQRDQWPDGYTSNEEFILNPSKHEGITEHLPEDQDRDQDPF